MSIVVTESELRKIQLKTRMPFRYGIASMTEFPLAFVRIRAQIDGVQSFGIASDLLPPKWFTKVPDKPLSEEIDEMLEVIHHAMNRIVGIEFTTVFGLWQTLYEAQADFGTQKGYPPLLAHFGTSLAERAVMEAFCRARQTPFAQAVSSNAFGIQLHQIHPELGNAEPSDFLPKTPLSRLIARHTIGLSDPLRENEIPPAEALQDGLPQSLENCIRRYGLTHFKVKISGNLNDDLPRLQELCQLTRQGDVRQARFSLDGNEQFASASAFRSYWEALRREQWFDWLSDRLLFVEQPLHRNVALQKTDDLLHWKQRPPTIIDESDGELCALPQALKLGYNGASHKNCKGVFKGIANRCLIEKRARQSPTKQWVISGEDLCNQGPVALLQDLAVMSCLGIQSVERNGHHYCAGLSAFPASLQNQVLQNHPDLYHQTERGWPSLTIENGSLSLRTVNQSPFGLGLHFPFDSLPT